MTAVDHISHLPGRLWLNISVSQVGLQTICQDLTGLIWHTLLDKIQLSGSV